MFTEKIILHGKFKTACIFFLAVSFTGLAQTNLIQSTGNVGIGTTSPAVPLQVKGDVILGRGSGGNNFMRIHSDINGVYLTSDDPNTNQKHLFLRASPTNANGKDRHLFIQAGKSNGNWITRMAVMGGGNVGIGTTGPTHRLHVAGSGKWTGNSSSYTEIHSNGNGQYLRQFANDGTTQSWIIRGYATGGVQALFNSGGINVNGTVKAKEVNITVSGWPDYVFRPGYKLMPLGELEGFILENGHLPNIPSEAEVTENGVRLGELNAKLLEKIEELTLYTITQEEKINALVIRLEHLENRK
ncbi:hypothetical protein [Lunatibacter salilacus]|uniref:hypothetical protein n=1 Tax=Lunatibacter salilacus TaxID=2483804 RepID=UPI00131DB73D|nr:hypothetical protein [Lunatibacter salilacus]